MAIFHWKCLPVINMNQLIKNYLKEEKERKRLYDFHSQERKLKDDYPILVGVDEAGRGPLAGPVYAACVCLPTGIFINGLNDSKKMSEEKRNLIAEEIKKRLFFIPMVIVVLKK